MQVPRAVPEALVTGQVAWAVVVSTGQVPFEEVGVGAAAVVEVATVVVVAVTTAAVVVVVTITGKEEEEKNKLD